MTISDPPRRNVPRVPWRAGALSLAIPGLGHVYAGHGRRGLAIFGLVALSCWAQALLALGDSLTVGSFWLIRAVRIGGSGLALLDSVRLARRYRGEYLLNDTNRWYAYLSIGFVGALLLATPLGAVQVFRVPARSMVPTIAVGDWIVANRWSYRRAEPKRGDVIVFHFPMNPAETYLKRVVGLPGETVEIHDRRVVVDGREIDDPWGHCPDGRRIGSAGADCGRATPRLDSMSATRVPEQGYFVLGDDRQQSQDSRFWGPVPRDLLVGKIVGIYWSWDGRRHLPRLDRIGSLTAPQQ
ncbi:MAG: signal peptidase I [bacterium]